ncbi:MAG TPA: PEP-CTERM sorting domain-containing protein [Methylomirabilota bacterium]|nr:PEP-CTERM sorting domain-containing protein [Methylomirabilota bacterium]
MKCFAVGFSILVAVSAWGQGSIHFGNTPTTLITTNDFQGHIGNILGPGNYRFGLYTGPLGAPGSLLTLTTVATNGATPGRFDGGTEPLAGFPTGSQVSFQVRGWSIFGGPSYETAAAIPGAYIGESTIGFFTVPMSGTIEVFGTGPGQVGGFVLTPVVPEPSAYALAALGLCALVFCRRLITKQGRR